jgi:hypothetical protein
VWWFKPASGLAVQPASSLVPFWLLGATPDLVDFPRKHHFSLKQLMFLIIFEYLFSCITVVIINLQHCKEFWDHFPLLVPVVGLDLAILGWRGKYSTTVLPDLLTLQCLDIFVI